MADLRETTALQNGRGIILMALGMFIFAAADTMAKLLTDNLHPLQIVWIRQLGLLSVAVWFIFQTGRGIFATDMPKSQILRGLCAATSATCFIIGIKYVPLADAVAVTFIAPFIVTLLGAIALKEPVGPRRWAAVIIGFLATLIIIRPGMGVMHPAIMFIVAAAAVFALRQVLSRALAHGDSMKTTVVYTALVGSAVLTVPLPFIWQWPETGREYMLLAGFAVLAAIGEILVIRALILAQSVVVAPVHYTIILWSGTYGFLVFGDIPDGWTILGAVIIMVTGLYTLHRERLADRARMAAPEN